MNETGFHRQDAESATKNKPILGVFGALAVGFRQSEEETK